MSDLIHSLGIEWKILIAQVINFGILFLILRHFLYKPILKTLDKRRSDIQKEKEGRLELEAKLQEILRIKDEMLQKTRKESAELLKSAEISAVKIKDRILQEAKTESEKMRNEAKKSMSEEKITLMRDVKREIGSLVALAIEKTLGDVLDEKTEEKLASGAMSKINSSKS